VQWQPIEERLERVEVPAEKNRPAGIGLRLRREGGEIPIAMQTLYFLAWEVEVGARTAQRTPDWVRRWDVPFGRVEEFHQTARLRTGGRDHLGVGNLTELVDRLTAAQVNQSLGARRVPLRIAFRLEE
jgi:hypothetical protein